MGSLEQQETRNWVHGFGLIAGPLLAGLAAWIIPQFEVAANFEPFPLQAMAAVATLMAIWWITEAIPLAATALLPLVLFPALHLLPIDQVAAHYGNRLIFLFLGGFVVALAIEETGLHRRVALTIVSWVGDQPRRLVAGFMLATAILSMWLSNTATALMLLPIASSVLSQIEKLSETQEIEEALARRQRHFGVCLMLGIAYAASIGGFSTLIGTPPNVAYRGIFHEEFPHLPEASFAGWMLFALPLAFTLLLGTWWLLTVVLFPVGSESFLGGQTVIKEEKEKLGPLRSAEGLMLFVFFLTAGLWVFREPTPDWGWAPLLGLDEMTLGGKQVRLVDDSAVAIAMAVLCFLLPKGTNFREPLLPWNATKRLPWGILILFGGGLALAAGMKESGLAALLGDQLALAMKGQSPIVRTFSTAAGMTLITELSSNLASVQMMLPILAETSRILEADPQKLMIPATLAASCAFMLPVATPPNAIVYSSGRVSIRQMVFAGIWVNLIGTLLITLFVSISGFG
ncbi:Sodium-dependent dicarboxylate transporter SdcS [Planctomycetales bacterium 10988]|nr:Sodium-dependent dicarboxylate transporter SdcS [Planctomycetales bacterium 10988]